MCAIEYKNSYQKLLCLQWKCGLRLEMALSVDVRRGLIPGLRTSSSPEWPKSPTLITILLSSVKHFWVLRLFLEFCTTTESDYIREWYTSCPCDYLGMIFKKTVGIRCVYRTILCCRIPLECIILTYLLQAFRKDSISLRSITSFLHTCLHTSNS